MKARIDFLDFMRVFAFLSVLVGHKFYLPLIAVAGDPASHVTLRYIAHVLVTVCQGGAAGVMVFFFTSGYIITHVLRSEATAEFLVKRLFRIYPLYMFAIVVEMMMGSVFLGQDFPPLSVLVPRLLLIGDFFETPYALAGVEWTLRIEVVFYAFMAVMKAARVLERPRWLPAVFVVCTALLHMAPPFPLVASWSVGYFTLYAPFLFVGAMIYLAEHDMASRAYCAAGIAFVFIAFFQLIPEIHPAWKESTYATYALFLFLVAWRFRDRLVAGPLIRLLSDLTYAVYLFHNWLWQHLQAVVVKIGWIGVSPEIQVFLVLLPVCYVVHRTVEKGGIRLGRLILARYGTRSSEPLSLAPVV